MRATVLGAAGTVQGFDTFWAAAATVITGVADPACYAHHRLGDPRRLAAMLTTSGWSVHDIHPMISQRRCDADELWRWLWGSLPLLRTDGTFLEGCDRAEGEQQVRAAFFDRAELFRDGDTFTICSLAHLLIASAAETHHHTEQGNPG